MTMLQRIDVTDDGKLQSLLRAYRTRGITHRSEQDARRAAVTEIVDAVRDRGDEAVAEFTRRFDGVDLSPDAFEVSRNEMEQASRDLPRETYNLLQKAHEQIRAFHARGLRESWQIEYDDGSFVGQRVLPLDRVGVYVPGGKAFYPSSVLMNIVPAKVAGVGEVIMVSPPSWNGTIHPAVLAAAYIAGADRVFRVGGAQSVAALAYGTEKIPAVSKITGPGNAYVTLAKAMVRGMVEIDSEAGPSEVVVLADDDAHPEQVAAELFAQAEHDEEAVCVLITPSERLLTEVMNVVATQAPKLARAAIAVAALTRFGQAVLTRSLEDAVLLVNAFAPEHLSVQTRYPNRLLDQIRNAGAVMLGAMTPVALGDYGAGPNHILPTMGRARFASPLTAEDFRKVSSVLCFSRPRLAAEADYYASFADLEGLEAHARSIRIRVNREGRNP